MWLQRGATEGSRSQVRCATLQTMAEQSAPPAADPAVTPRQEILLAFLAGGEQDMDPVRIMKGLFVFGQECQPEWLGQRPLYRFEPYNYGPFSAEIYRDLERLVARGLVEAREVIGQRWKHHRATPAGRRVAAEIRRRLDPKAVRYLDQMRAFTLAHSFHDLLRMIYKKYPAYAVRSVFQF